MTVVRFAPSPTGFLHLGSARTALFNWLYARRMGGKFILRIEDTDLTRSETRFLEEILRDLKWLGLDWDGEPVYQSKRFSEYKSQAEKFVQEGKAYREGEAYIFKVEKGKTIEVDDMIHGKISFNTDEIKDQVMIKSDGSPAYNFCCVVDDAAMGVTHIIRGDDHISNTPKQVLFYAAMGLVPPKFAHMPLVMGADGAKLSKRHGAVAVEEYKNEGYLPEALANYLMLLGWNPADGREVLSLAEAAKVFDVKDMNDVQVRFDDQKLRWLNGEHIMAKSVTELLPLVAGQFEKAGISTAGADNKKFEKLIELYKPRMKTFTDIVRLADWFFKDEYAVDEKGAKKHLESAENKDNLKEFAARLEKVTDFSAANIEAACRAIAEERSLKAAGIIHPTRMAISGKTEGAGLFEIMEVLGKEKVIERLKKAAA